MNLMILSPGRRVDIVNYFKNEINLIGGKVFTVDMSEYAPALYFGDQFFIVNKDFNNLDLYVDNIIKLCKDNNINAVISLVDPELKLLADNIEKFNRNGIKVILSDKKAIDNTFDKFSFYENYKEDINLVKTIDGFHNAKKALEEGEIVFPIFAKIKNGSGSIGIGKINSMDELNNYSTKENYIFQQFIKGKEYGVDVYFDLISKKITSLFIKEKICMRAGETDKSISVYRKDIVDEVMKIENMGGFLGPIDVDVFVSESGEIYINEINPRFGGGYPHAYNCGVNFIKNIFNNIQGIENTVNIGNYETGVIMMKYNGILFK